MLALISITQELNKTALQEKAQISAHEVRTTQITKTEVFRSIFWVLIVGLIDHVATPSQKTLAAVAPTV